MSVLSDSGKRKFSCICFMTQQARAPPHTVESKEVSAEKKIYIKRELTFLLQPYYTHGLGSLKFSSGSSPTVSRMSIYHGNSLTDARCGTIFMPLLYSVHLRCMSTNRRETKLLSRPSTPWPPRYQNGPCPLCNSNIVVLRM